MNWLILFFCDFQGRWKIGIKNHQKHRKIQRSCQTGNKCSRENQRKGPRWAVVSASLYSYMLFSAESSLKWGIELSSCRHVGRPYKSSFNSINDQFTICIADIIKPSSICLCPWIYKYNLVNIIKPLNKSLCKWTKWMLIDHPVRSIVFAFSAYVFRWRSGLTTMDICV